MSRMIDADELMKAMYHRAFETDGDTMWQSGCWVRYKAIEQVVKEQPTIERKTGKWIVMETAYEDTEAKCSECGFTTLVNEPGNGLHMLLDLKYCPNCGARMEI